VQRRVGKLGVEEAAVAAGASAAERVGCSLKFKAFLINT
jgi:hypothetical protein